MNVTVNLIDLAAIVACLITIATFYFGRKKSAQEEGARMTDIKKMQEQIAAMEAEIVEFRRNEHMTEVAMAKISERLDYLKEAIDDIKLKVDAIVKDGRYD